MRSDVQALTPVLEVLSGDLAGRSYAIDEREFFIGRATSCDIVIPRRYISREHARIVCRDGEWLVEGLSEKNPVLVRERPARGHRLADGDVFELCGIQFRFVAQGKVQGRRGKQQRMSGSRAAADDSWDDEPVSRPVSDSGPVRKPADDSWDDAPVSRPVSDSGPVRKPADDSWDDEPVSRPVSDSGPVRQPADDSWSDEPIPSPGRASDTGPSYSGRQTGSVQGSQRVVFEVEGDVDQASASGLEAGSAADQTAELGKVDDPDDPDYDPFKDVEVAKKKRKVDPGREKALRVMLVVGGVGILFAGYFLYVITRPKKWEQSIYAIPIEVAVDEVVEFTYEWATDDPPEGRRGTSLEGREYDWLPDNDYAHVEWAVPHILSRSVFLIRGKAEGPTKFWLSFGNSRQKVGFDVQVTGEPLHERFRAGRVQEFKAKSPRELRREIESRSASGERYTEERNVDGKEGYYREAVEQFQAATDAALALQSSLAAKGVVPKADQDLVIRCEEREKRAEREHQEFVDRELALYRASVQRDNRAEQLRQLRRVLRAINHSCELEFQRLKLILEECFEVPFQEPLTTCPASR